MKKPVNVWNIKEYEGDGKRCPVILVDLPWHKKLFLTFFRFGLCPSCIVMSLGYKIGRVFKKITGRIKTAHSQRVDASAE